jgi:hypothetical protein
VESRPNRVAFDRRALRPALIDKKNAAGKRRRPSYDNLSLKKLGTECSPPSDVMSEFGNRVLMQDLQIDIAGSAEKSERMRTA